MDEELRYYQRRASDHRSRAETTASDGARIAHLALADAYERRCALAGGTAVDSALQLRHAPQRGRRP